MLDAGAQGCPNIARRTYINYAQIVARSAPSPAPAAAVDLTAGTDFVIPPVRQSYGRRAPDDDAVPTRR